MSLGFSHKPTAMYENSTTEVVEKLREYEKKGKITKNQSKRIISFVLKNEIQNDLKSFLNEYFGSSNKKTSYTFSFKLNSYD